MDKVKLQGHYSPDKCTEMGYYGDMTYEKGYATHRGYHHACERAGIPEGDYLEIAPGQRVQEIDIMKYQHENPVQVLRVGRAAS